MQHSTSPDMSLQLGSAPVGRLLLKLAVPTVLAQLVNLLYNIVDRIYIGHMPVVGETALTGVGLCFPVGQGQQPRGGADPWHLLYLPDSHRHSFNGCLPGVQRAYALSLRGQ